MTTIVINREDSQKEVNIFSLLSGEKTSVFVQPMSKTKLAEGFAVSPDFQRLHPKIQVIVSGTNPVSPPKTA